MCECLDCMAFSGSPSHSGLPYVDLKDAPKKMIPFKLIETFKMNI
jgi:hypothetical protein